MHTEESYGGVVRQVSVIGEGEGGVWRRRRLKEAKKQDEGEAEVGFEGCLGDEKNTKRIS